MTFEDKSPEMQDFLEAMFGTRTALKTKTCPTCDRPIEGFRDELSRKEYSISGMCQMCQDSVFGGGDED